MLGATTDCESRCRTVRCGTQHQTARPPQQAAATRSAHLERREEAQLPMHVLPPLLRLRHIAVDAQRLQAQSSCRGEWDCRCRSQVAARQVQAAGAGMSSIDNNSSSTQKRLNPTSQNVCQATNFILLLPAGQPCTQHAAASTSYQAIADSRPRHSAQQCRCSPPQTRQVGAIWQALQLAVVQVQGGETRQPAEGLQ